MLCIFRSIRFVRHMLRETVRFTSSTGQLTLQFQFRFSVFVPLEFIHDFTNFLPLVRTIAEGCALSTMGIDSIDRRGMTNVSNETLFDFTCLNVHSAFQIRSNVSRFFFPSFFHRFRFKLIRSHAHDATKVMFTCKLRVLCFIFLALDMNGSLRLSYLLSTEICLIIK